MKVRSGGKPHSLYVLTMFKAIKQELQIWQQHRHPYILPLIGVYFHQGMPCAVSPWCDSGTILQYMKSARAGHEPELDAPVRNCEFDLLRLHCLEIRLVCQINCPLFALKLVTALGGRSRTCASYGYHVNPTARPISRRTLYGRSQRLYGWRHTPYTVGGRCSMWSETYAACGPRRMQYHAGLTR